VKLKSQCFVITAGAAFLASLAAMNAGTPTPAITGFFRVNSSGRMWQILTKPGQETAAADAAESKLQIINGSQEPIRISSEADQKVLESVEPGKDTVLTTRIGGRFEIAGPDGKNQQIVVSEVLVQGHRFDPGGRDGVPAFYTQSVSANGFPIVASASVNPYALKEAEFIVNQMLANRPDVRTAMIRSGARMCILSKDQYTTDLPEFARMAEEKMEDFPDLSARDFWDARARGLGGSETDPFCCVAEENVLGFPGDPYEKESILIHEFAHNIHLRGLLNVDPTFDKRLQTTYQAAVLAGLWKGKYAAGNRFEYFAEGVQSWFDDNRENDHDHNHVNTRAELLVYDPGLAAICREVFGDTVLKYSKPATRLTGHMAGYDPAKAPSFVWPERLLTAKQQIRAAAEKRDQTANGGVGHEIRPLVGWSVHINRKLQILDDAGTARALELLRVQLEEIVRVVPAAAVAELRKVPLWISPEYPNTPPRAEYHPWAEWLRNNGRDPAMAKGVEFTNVRIFEEEVRRMPNFALHELAHAYHDLVLERGNDNAEVSTAWLRAKISGKYDSVERRDAKGGTRMDRAYALTNPMEYFAEGTEAYFVRNDFYPYQRTELEQHDPELCKLLAKLWGVDLK
jgi:hypothetical protein